MAKKRRSSKSPAKKRAAAKPAEPKTRAGAASTNGPAGATRPAVKKSQQHQTAGRAPTRGAASDGARAAGARRSGSRLLPQGEELRRLYARYTAGSAFDDHDKAFYFVLDVGGIDRARQLIDHVREVLCELEEFQG